MSLEYFKKQVLLLHSEQSTLDTLSSGFNDRYTVHCATSGTEALHTLGETEIDVIVTAQELPGMSGLDALREAKKRSPDTIGILLAGNSNDGLEALVGDQEVFQIVRGSVTPESLKKLIDNATRQARLLALAESANDTTANPDEPVGEHIVMETSENGSAIISDGTGRLPILDAKKISAAADIGARAVDVLVLTQDEDFLATVKESARGLHNVIYANTLSQADEAVRKNKVGVAVVDAAMVGANVEKLAMHLRAQSPRLVAVVAGRRDDGEMLMDLINRGKVYRFLLKPVSPGRSRLAIEASVKHHLEAPESAFKIVGDTALPPMVELKPQAKPEPKPAPKPAPAAPQRKAPSVTKPATPAPVAKVTPASKPAPAPVPRAKPKASPTIVPKREEALSPIDDGLSEAFGGNDSSVTETIAGFASTVARTFSSKMKKPTTEPAVATAMAVAIDPAAASAGSGGSLWSNPRNLGTGAAAVVVIIGLLFWIFSGTEEPTVADEPLADTPINVAEPVFETDVVAPQQTEVDDLIDEAQLAADAGQIFTPPGSNAIELYMSALAVAPGDPVAEAGLQQVVERALSMAESALLERRSEDAEAALQRVALANPENPRLPFLHAQLAQIQLRNFLDDARQAIRDLRFEDAQLSLDGARQLTVTDASEIDVVADELSAALSAQRVDDVLAQASTRLAEGKLIAPSNDNARFYYELALSNDPANSAARQGLQVVAGKLVLQARAEIDAGNFEAADALLIDSRRLDPSSSELAAAATALNAARDRQVQEARRAAERKAAAEKAAAEQAAAEKLAAERAAAEKLAAEQAAAEKLAAERAAAEKAAAEKALAEQAAAEKLAAERAAAEKLAAEQAAAEKALAEQAAAERAAAEKLAAERAAAEQAAAEEALAEQATAERAAAEKLAADVPVAAIAAAGVAGGARPDGDALAGQVGKTAQTAGSSAAADTKQAAGQASPPPLQPSSAATRAADPVSVSSLNRIKYVAPRYPRVAQRRGLSGWVDVVFTVDIDGTVTDVSIRDSDPGDTFVSSAVSAVEDWEFEPVIEDGVAVQKRAAVRMMFAME